MQTDHTVYNIVGHLAGAGTQVENSCYKKNGKRIHDKMSMPTRLVTVIGHFSGTGNKKINDG